MGTIHVQHTFNVSEDRFWAESFMNPEFNTKLYNEGLEFQGYKVVQDDDDGKVVRRKIRATPKQEAPKAVQKVVGDGSFTEEGVYDREKKRYTFQIIPDTMASKTEIRGEMWTEPRGDGQCDRKLKVDISIKIFGVGKLVEGFVEKTTRDSYDKAAEFTLNWFK